MNAWPEALRLDFAGFGLAVARLTGLFLILPLATRLGLTGLPRGGVAAGLALPFAHALGASLGPGVPPAAHLLLLGVKETFVGTLLGMMLAVPFWAAEAAGEYLDQQRNSQGAVHPDPAGAAQTGTTGTLLVLTVVMLFLLSGGMRLLLDAVTESYRLWPVARLAPALSAATPTLVLGLLDGVARTGLLLAAPLLSAMLLAELSLALVSRFAPQLNVFDLAMSVKGLVFTFGLFAYAVLLLGYLRDGLVPLAGTAALLRALAGA